MTAVLLALGQHRERTRQLDRLVDVDVARDHHDARRPIAVDGQTVWPDLLPVHAETGGAQHLLSLTRGSLVVGDHERQRGFRFGIGNFFHVEFFQG